MECVLRIFFCHLIGDYVLQNDYIAQTKGKSWYHLFVHCFLYCVPFYVCFGHGWRLYCLLLSHIIIDPLKARYDIIDYATDQILHYVIALLLYLIIA